MMTPSITLACRLVTLVGALMAMLGGTAYAAEVNRQGEGSTSRGLTGRTIDTTFMLERGALLDLSLPFGEISVNGWNRDDMRIRASAGSGQVTLRISATGALLRPTSERGGFSGLRYEVTVPAGVRVLMRTTSGTLIARGVRGDIEAHNISGRVELSDIAGLADIASVSGQVAGANLNGGLRADVTSGEVNVSGAEGEIVIDNSSGTITLSGIRSTSVRVETMSGSVSFQGTIESAGRYEFTAHSGSIKLILPPSVGALLTAATYTGSITSEFTPPPQTMRRGDHEKRLELLLGDGSARITAETFSGAIIIGRGTNRPWRD
jgi:DUF4097 and DUF4098 domain-containing protein YvlB